jgi:hypothetical protein
MELPSARAAQAAMQRDFGTESEALAHWSSLPEAAGRSGPPAVSWPVVEVRSEPVSVRWEPAAVSLPSVGAPAEPVWEPSEPASEPLEPVSV